MELKFLEKISSKFKKEKVYTPEEPPFEVFKKKTGTKIAAIGDFHIPGRAKKIPSEFEKILKREKPDKILCTGDFTTKDTYEKLKTLGPVESIIGNMDIGFKLPFEKKISIGKYFIGLVHGHGIHPRGDIRQLTKKTENMGVDILLHGHTHYSEIQKDKRSLILNPGSATGVWGGGGDEDRTPSFIILELDETVKVRLLRLLNGELKEKIHEFDLFEKKAKPELKEI